PIPPAVHRHLEDWMRTACFQETAGGQRSCDDRLMEQVNSRVVYRNPWMTVREDVIRHADGSPGIYGVVEKPDFALVLPRWSRGFWLVEQYRYPVGRRACKFPQGSWGN